MNAKQILNVVSATFPTFEDEGPFEDCQVLTSSVDKLACYWRDLNIRLADLKDGDQETEAWHLSVLIVSSLLC